MDWTWITGRAKPRPRVITDEEIQRRNDNAGKLQQLADAMNKEAKAHQAVYEAEQDLRRSMAGEL